ncbi:MAG: ubiquinol-cytochrome C chaperone family protein [Oceanicaulis sp.]|uniref:ubiquinol-cytochrome C chaperone family protein n=1 Tax=Glycocaulis sp. TaxID=1969725 RepID=UPI0025B7F9C7|nr:ubiquinol-cytochrome C chaperone family protein [Glycocaulis sp.]MCC5980724.1 ubiquinol-cytochrome C chaperone family protein [Oceanicaulis sp.]MCH8521089.1 ubiquinol-cytochrome C chaperone family protein [Glycocaulis sp.]
MPSLLKLFRKDPVKAQAAALYRAMLERAREPSLYGDEGAPDTVDGRFDLIVLHASLIMRHLRGEGEEGQRLAQALFARMFDDMDAALREMGIGDLSVGKKIKAMAEAFYGRAAAYDTALKAGDAAALKDALWRNLFDSAPERESAASRLADYAMAADARLAGTPMDAFQAARLPVLQGAR